MSWVENKADHFYLAFDDNHVVLPAAILNGRQDFEVEFDFFATLPQSMAIVSTANSSQNNEFLIFPGDNGFNIYIKGTPKFKAIEGLRDGKWHRAIVRRFAAAGEVELIVDGDSLGKLTGYPAGALAVDDGGLILGQDQDCVGGCFQSSQAFRGGLDNVKFTAGGETIAHYEMEAGSSEVLRDSSANGFDGTIFGAVWSNKGETLWEGLTLVDKTWQEEAPSLILSLDGVDDYAEVPYNVLFDFEKTEAFSVVLRVRTGSSVNNQVPFDRRSLSPDNGYGMSIFPDRTFTPFVENFPVGRAHKQTTVPLGLDSWYMLGFTYDGSQSAAGLIPYLNGIVAPSIVKEDDLSTNPSIKNTGPVRFGNNRILATPLKGGITECQLYKRVLTPQEVSTLYAGEPISLTSQIAHWVVRETGFIDISGNGLNAILNGPLIKPLTEWSEAT